MSKIGWWENLQLLEHRCAFQPGPPGRFFQANVEEFAPWFCS